MITNKILTLKPINFSNLNNLIIKKNNIPRIITNKKNITPKSNHSNEKESTKDNSNIHTKFNNKNNISNINNIDISDININDKYINYKNKIPNKDRNKYNLNTEPTLNKNNSKIFTNNTSFKEFNFKKAVKLSSLNKLFFNIKTIKNLFNDKISNKKKSFSVGKFKTENISKNISKINIKDSLIIEDNQSENISSSFELKSITEKFNNIKKRTEYLLNYYSNINNNNKLQYNIPKSSTNNHILIQKKNNNRNQRNNCFKRNRSTKSDGFSISK